MAYKVCLLDSDPAYQRALMEYLNLRAAIPIQLYVFSNPVVYQTFREHERPALLLVGDSYVDCLDAEDCPVLVLTANRENIGRDRYFFRYQSAEQLTAEMLKMVDAERECRIEEGVFLAVYSPLGRCGKTTFARELCRRYPNSLYVNWEGIPAQLEEGGIGSWMLYCMKSRNAECFSYLQEQGCRELPPPESYQDIRQMEAQDIQWLQQEIRKRRLYKRVVFDIGGLALAGYAVLKAFDKVFVPVLKDTVSEKKVKVFEQMLQQEQVVLPGLQYISQEEMNAGALTGMQER